MRFLLLSLAVVASFCFVGCDGGAEGEGEGDAAEGEGDVGEGEGEGEFVVGSIDEFCDGFHGAICAGFSACGCSLEGRAFDADTCVSVRAGECKVAFGQLTDVIEAGDLVLDGRAIAACVARAAALADSCSAIEDTALGLPCANFILANVGFGATCIADGLPCAAGAGRCTGGESPVCAPIPGAGEVCSGFCTDGFACLDGVCAALPGVGASCEFTGRCADGLNCLENVCTAPLAVGAGPCRGPSDCAAGLACSDDHRCATAPPHGTPCGGLTCGSGDSCVRAFAERSCEAKVNDGEACVFNDDDCVNGYCDTAAGVCAELPVEGELCPDARCVDGFVCDFNVGGICVIAPIEGEPCLVGPAACAPGLGCNTDNICAAPGGVGSACLIPNNLCADGLGCDFTVDGSFCVERRGVGEHCESDVCADGLFCDFTSVTCQPFLPPGTDCPTGGGCAVGDECGDLLGGHRCHDVPSVPGAPCSESCDGGLVCHGLGGVCAAGICGSN